MGLKQGRNKLTRALAAKRGEAPLSGSDGPVTHEKAMKDLRKQVFTGFKYGMISHQHEETGYAKKLHVGICFSVLSPHRSFP